MCSFIFDHKFFITKNITPEEEQDDTTKMAASFVPNVANPFFSISIPSTNSLPLTPAFNIHRARRLFLCQSSTSEDDLPRATRRDIAFSLAAGLALPMGLKNGLFHSSNAGAAVLEADDDVELLEKVKKDRKKRLERQGFINSSNKEKGYLQYLVYKLSEVGQAIDKNDLLKAGSVLGGSVESDWLKNANTAFTKLSSSPEEKTAVDTFNSSLSSLISSVTKNDIESSKVAFVSSASALERWTTLTGLVDQLKGL